MFRLVLIPIFAYTALSDNSLLNLVAALAFGIAALTDWLDGFLARRLNQGTEFGKAFDPAVDRLLILSALVILYMRISSVVPAWALAIVIARDLLLVAGWLVLLLSGKKMQVIKEGKIATAVLMVSVFVLLLGFQDSLIALRILGIFLFYVGVLLSLASGLIYVRLAITALLAGKERA